MSYWVCELSPPPSLPRASLAREIHAQGGSALRIHFDRIRQVDSVFRIDVDILCYIYMFDFYTFRHVMHLLVATHRSIMYTIPTLCHDFIPSYRKM